MGHKPTFFISVEEEEKATKAKMCDPDTDSPRMKLITDGNGKHVKRAKTSRNTAERCRGESKANSKAHGP